MKSRRSTRPFIAWVCLTGVGSCQPAGPDRYPVTGIVHHNGQPAAGAAVVFVPTDPTVTDRPSGAVGEDGTYTLQTYPHGPGVLPGDYKVSVTWYPPDARLRQNAKNRLPAVYADPERTPVPNVTVAAGPVIVPPIEIKSP